MGIQSAAKKERAGKKSGVGGILLFWIPALVMTALAVLASLAFSQSGIPSAPAGREQAILHLASSLFTEGEFSLSDEDVSSLLFPAIQNAFSEGEGLTGFSVEAKEENKFSLSMGFRASGSRLGLFCSVELLPEKEGFYGLRIASASLGKLPVPPRWVLEKARNSLSSFGKVEEDTLWIPSSVAVPLWEGTEPLTLKLTDLSAGGGELRAGISAESIPLELLGKLLAG